MEDGVEFGMAAAQVAHLNEYGRFVLTVDSSKKRLGVFGPTEMSHEERTRLFALAQGIVATHENLDTLIKLVVDLVGDSAKVTPFLDEQTKKTLAFGKSLETFVEQMPKLEGVPMWNSKAFMKELLDNEQANALCRVLDTIYPVKCEAYLLSGIFRNCFKKLSYVRTTNVSATVVLELKDFSLLQRVMTTLQTRVSILKCNTISAMLTILDVKFDWNMVGSMIDSVNLLAKTLECPAPTFSSDKLWAILVDVMTDRTFSSFPATKIALVDIKLPTKSVG
jgi:hypothetical protein